MKTEIIDRTTQGGSAKESLIGKEGYFWDNERGTLVKDKLSITYEGMEYSYKPFMDIHCWKNFSESIPEWFLPINKKPIELVSCIEGNGSTTRAMFDSTNFSKIERIAADVCGFDLLRCTHSGRSLFYLGHWNDGIL